jgi:hypothetical protein
MKYILAILTTTMLFITGCSSVEQPAEVTSSALISLARFDCPVNKNLYQIAYWQRYCSLLVAPIAPSVCSNNSTIDIRNCTCEYADTFPICNIRAAYQYLLCSKYRNNWGCQDNNNFEFPWIVDYSTECFDIQNSAFGC